MKCTKFTRKQLRTYADSWSFEMEEGLWHRIWDHLFFCPSCEATVMRAHAERNRETEEFKNQYPNLYQKVMAPAPLNWQETRFKSKRKRKLKARQ